jgi:hypothetical protein
MSDDDNYTIEDSDDPPVEGFAEPPDDAGSRDGAAVGVLILGLLTIAGAGLCGAQANFDNTPPGKTTFFITSLTLPLSIVGALLTVIGVCILVFRLRLPRPGE